MENEVDKILVIDDSLLQATVLKDILKEQYDVTCVTSAFDGIAEAYSGIYSLIVVDMVMPERHGFDILTDIKESEVSKNTPVIIVTSMTGEGIEEKGLELGAVDFITKPFKPAIVRARVKVHIQLRKYAEQLEKLMMNDQLTGIGNRRYFDVGSVNMWNKCIRSRSALSICMFDIDNFKTYNDTFGHPAGDKVIQAIANVLKESFKRCTDLVARYGGEEFVVVMTDGEARKDFDYACVVRQRIEDLQIEHNPVKQPVVTVSIGGVTVHPRHSEDVTQFLQMADDNLYKSKESGRNRVTWTSNRMEQWEEKE